MLTVYSVVKILSIFFEPNFFHSFAKNDRKDCIPAVTNMTPMDEPPSTNRNMAEIWPDLLQQHGRWMRSAALARLREADAVEEVLQNVALAVVHALQTGTEIQQTGAWLYRVLLRQCLLFRRRKGRDRKMQERLACHEVKERDQGSPLHWLLANERSALVRQAMQTLPDKEMEILLLKYVERWSCQQIADHMQVSPTAIESRLHRARQRLRMKLEQMNLSSK